MAHEECIHTLVILIASILIVARAQEQASGCHFASSSPSYAYIKDNTPMFYNLTHLKLSIEGDYVWNLFTNMLYRSHQLEILVVDKDYGPRIDGGPSWTHLQTVPSCLSPCLKKVWFRQFHGWDCELEFTGYILKNARVLETMAITFFRASCLSTEAKLKIINKIYTFPTSSETCQFLFYGMSSENPSLVLDL